MSTPPESPTSTPELDVRVEGLLGELASRLSKVQTSADNQEGEVVGADALTPQDLPNFHRALQGAALRTGAVDLLYRPKADSSDTAGAEATTSETAAPEIPDSYNDPGSALGGAETSAAIMADVQELRAPGGIPTQSQ